MTDPYLSKLCLLVNAEQKKQVSWSVEVGICLLSVILLVLTGLKFFRLGTNTAFLRPDTLADTNNLELFVFSNDDEGRMVLCARLDNLGKGASGAAVQNLNLSLGLDEATGL
jgi:N-acetyl-gamma-glutamyl-phosphate reductase